MKRMPVDNSPGANKRRRAYLKEVDSAYDQAKPYRLITAKFPIDALTPKWSMGTNRPIDENHKRRLYQIFHDVGVARQDTNHRLQAACTKSQVQKMLDYLGLGKGEAQDAVGARETVPGGGSKFPSFEDWNRVVGEPAELMAGNHRVEAFKEYLDNSQSSQTERWWVCDIYDKDALPPHLHVKLRANREGVTLPDNHGQIWMELATLSSNDKKLFQDSNKVVEQQMLDHLGLGGRVKFPVRRLATLWKNNSWNPVITRWCQFPIGQATFMISTFEWMASCRIDDFWFAAFEQVLQILSEIRDRFKFEVQLSDWNKLVDLGTPRSVKDVRGLFFPSVMSSEEPCLSSTRSQDFLPTISDVAYHGLYNMVISDQSHRFVDIQALLRTTKQEGKLMSIAMSHVSQWMNRNPTKVADRDNNKPVLRNDLIPCLQHKYGEEAEEKSVVLQNMVLNYVRGHSKDFTSPKAEQYLHKYPDGQGDAYTERFKHTAWGSLLALVLTFSGPNLQHKSMMRFNSEGFHVADSESSQSIAQTARDIVCQLPAFTSNPALHSASAADMLCAIIAEWASEQCTKALQEESKDWEPLTIKLVEVEQAKSEALLRTLSPFPNRRSSALLNLLGHPERAHEKDDGGERNRRSPSHGSVNEHASAKTNKVGQTPKSDPEMLPRLASQPFECTEDHLRDLRKQHRTKQVTRQPSKLQLNQAPTILGPSPRKDDEQPPVRQTTRRPNHWRQQAPASHRTR